MGKQVKKTKEEIATIDCCLVTIETAEGEFGFDTANQIAVEPQVEEEEAVKLVIKGILRAQKPKTSTITGNQITLTDNVFNPELVLVLQGGTIKYDPKNPDEIIGYKPPIAGSPDKGEVFKLNAYSAQYDASGQIVKYEKITYPNCQGTPVAFGSEDGAFRAPEYTIDSAPKVGEAPYSISYVESLPELVGEVQISILSVTSEPGTEAGNTKLTVVPAKEVFNSYYVRNYALTELDIANSDFDSIKYGIEKESLPGFNTNEYSEWDGSSDLYHGSTTIDVVVEIDEYGKVIAKGKVTVQAR